ncbi:menaquinone biosynthesis protein [Brevibacillus sp. SYP-B805]|uniref:menaquinone biosynthetic enzyme MqnA/MqnD family protein n=1 Tax=Brevibacillus sp. SYP-B805 TaxID=1578199 RepID=UPI0013ED3BEE|nr:menaquinone biosynthesis protein [Brevibacillus sp. SYP-B805]NGQ94573.1 menaquinone biosynthesis protein [Brevibacillus sp. SYP-B805]
MSPKQLRIGQIKYTNTLPVYFFFDEARFDDKIDFILQVPAQLNAAMARGEIDVGPISSFSYAEHHEQYLVLPGLSISAKRRVRSIYLFSKRPIEELDGAHIALTNTSATSVNLLKIILEKFLRYTVTYQTQAPVLEEMLAHADGALLIGDDALLAYRNNNGYHVYDLAELWYRYTGYSMTFAVWAVRKEAIEKHPGLLRDVHAAFLESKERSLQHLEQVVEAVTAQFGEEPSSWFEYFRGLCYDFTEEERRGLEHYYACAAELGLLRSPVKVRIWEEAVQPGSTR